MHSGSSVASSHSAVSMALGIASLILEGRALSEDDFVTEPPSLLRAALTYKNSTATTTNSSSENDAQRIIQKLQQLRSCPGTSKDAMDCPIALDAFGSLTSSDELDVDDDLSYGESPTKSDGIFLNSLQSLATSCLKTTPRTFSSTINVNAANSFHLLQCNTSPYSVHSGSGVATLRSQLTSSLLNSSPPVSKESTSGIKKKEQTIKQGPHCEIFLKKIAVHKSIHDEYFEYDEHVCDEMFNKHCRKWCLNTNQMKSILNRGENICIEVYLGPEIYPILMEQWIIQLTNKPIYPTMTIQSLCTAIRSQLYFSQISSWTNLINDNELDYVNNPRVKIPFNKCARLDIFYRIKTFIDTPTSFIDKPNIHNFPDAIISDHLAVNVLLKSAKRLEQIPESNSILMLVDDQRGPCQEKGKHRCKNSFEDDPLNDVVESVSPPSNSHRERQLLKYKRRLLKREKKKKSHVNTESFQSAADCAKYMEDAAHHQNFSTQASINSIRPPLYITSSSSPSSPSSSSNDSWILTKSTQTAPIELMSVSTQTDENINKKRTTMTMWDFNYDDEDTVFNYPSCDFCGSDMQAVCWNCDKLFKNNNNDNENIKNGDLLLQSIQRTALKKKDDCNGISNRRMNHRLQETNSAQGGHNCFTSSSPNKHCPETVTSVRAGSRVADEEYIERSTCDNLNNLDLSDCRLCIKRQKIKHNYNNNVKNSPPSSATLTSYRRTMSESLTGCIDEYDLTRSHPNSTITSSSLSSGLCFDELKTYRRAFSDDLIDSIADNNETNNTKCQCAESSPIKKPSEQTAKMRHRPHNLHLRVESPSQRSSLVTSPLSIKCPAELTRNIVKLNLTSGLDTHTPSFSSPPPPSLLINGSSDIFPIHKSNSAPTFNQIYSPTSLSPRFYKQAAIMKRRSRHLSERSSERSSIGSEEQFSDEELGCGLDNTYSPSVSPSKQYNTFGKFFSGKLKPLLGTLEESLFQKRFQPQFQINGFKVLLGASGGFCPTQLTIPAITSLYELVGSSLSTPYMCELRLPRKGYSIPITGTVQVTLLNPQGTVVRMFVVPYDLRDMPHMSTTFIRQRILAYDENANTQSRKPEELSNAEQMKLLRYSIHLRFQRSRSGRLSLHTDIKLLISRRTDCDTAAAHAKGILELPSELKTVTILPDNPKFSTRIDKNDKKSLL